MGNAYQPELWRELFVVLSSSSAVLIGLLFIATSLHLDEIINQPFFHRRAFNNTRYLLITFVEAVWVLISRCSYSALREAKAVVTQYHKYLKENSLIKSVFEPEILPPESQDSGSPSAETKRRG
jgi:hypothetical protein